MPKASEYFAPKLSTRALTLCFFIRFFTYKQVLYGQPINGL
jgi:hypothetical protein